MALPVQRRKDACTPPLHTCLVEDLVHDVTVVREVVFPSEDHSRDLNQEALSGTSNQMRCTWGKTRETKDGGRLRYTGRILRQNVYIDVGGLLLT